MCARRVLRSGPGSEALKGPVISPAGNPRQPRLFDNPMPTRVEPCLAQLASKPPSGENWAFEVKWDGYRLAIHVENDRRVRVITRGSYDWPARFPSVVAAAKSLAIDSVILDGGGWCSTREPHRNNMI